MNLSQYIEISELKKRSISSYNSSLIAIIDGVDVNDIGEWKLKDINKRAKEIHDNYLRLSKTKSYRLTRTLKTDAGELTYKSINEFDLSEYMDLEHYLKHNDVLGVIALVYRKFKASEYDSDEWEKHGGYIEKRKPLFKNDTAVKLLPAYHQIIKQRKAFLKQYKAIFEMDEFNYDEAKKTAKDENERRVLEEEEQKEKVAKSFNFEFMMLNYANFDFTKLEEISEMNVGVLFRFILAKKTLEKLQDNG